MGNTLSNFTNYNREDKKAEAIATAIMEHYLSTNFEKKGDIN